MEHEGSENDRDEMELVPSESRDLVYDKAYTCPGCGSVFNRDKVFCPACGLGVQEMLQPARQGDYSAEIGRLPQGGRSARIFALLSLILGIAGPLALGVGWLLAIIFGFTALNLIRGSAGSPREKKLAVWGISLGFFWPVAFFVIFSLYSYGRASERVISRNENRVEGLLIDIAVAQKFIKSGYFLEHEGRSFFADTNELLQIEHRLVPEGLQEHPYGYNVRMRVRPAEGFFVSAHPERYGVTGKRSFYIDETGVLRGGDTRAEQDFRAWTTLPRLKDGPVYEDYDNTIAESLIFRARRLASDGEFEKARRILSEIRTNYFMLPAAAKVSEVMESLERRIYEHMAEQKFRKALSMVRENKLREALSKMKFINSSYPEAVIITDVRAEIARVEENLSSLLEKEAKALFEKAERLEKEGDYEGAVALYRKIAGELDSTSYYEASLDLAEKANAKKQEQRAEDIFGEIAALNIEESYREAVSAADFLLSRYSETAFVRENIDRIQGVLNVGIGEREKNNAIKAFQQKNFNAAIQAGESAIKANPALRESLTPIVGRSYLHRAESLFVNGAYREALPYYEGWLELLDYRGAPEYENYLESRYNTAKNKFEAGDYGQAKIRLEGIERHFRRRAEFWYMLGSISAFEKDYPRAISRLERSLSIDEQNRKARYILALCKTFSLQQREDDLRELLNELFNLKRGARLFYDINSLVTGLNAKDLEIKHLSAVTDTAEAAVRRRARLPAERDSFEAEVRIKLLEYSDIVKANNELRGKVISTAGLVYDMYNEINAHIMKIPTGRRGREKREFVANFRAKRQFFENYFKLERGLNQETRLEENAMLYLGFALDKFSQERSFESELRDMSRLREGITQMGMQRSVDEGREGVLVAIGGKISVEEYLSEAAEGRLRE